MYIEDRMSETKELIGYFQNCTDCGNSEVLQKLSDLNHLIGENPLFVYYKSIILYNNGFLEDSREYLKEALKKYSRSYELHELYYELFKYSDNYEEVLISLSNMHRLAESEAIQQQVVEKMEKYVAFMKISSDDVKKYSAQHIIFFRLSDYRAYPIDQYGNSSIRLNIFQDRDLKNEYIVNLYKSMKGYDIDSNSRFYYLYEMIKGAFIKTQEKLLVSKEDIVAISAGTKDAGYNKVIIKNIEEEPVEFQLEPNAIRYFRMKNSGDVLIESEEDIFASVFKKNKIMNKPKLVVQLFIDGLSYQFLQENGFDELMPNTNELFRNGYINENCHATGEWTLPSLMSMCTGKYTTNHHVFHTDEPHNGESVNKFIQEYFEEAGYMTGRVCGNWRGTPSYGYFKGTNRSIYSPMVERMNCNEVVAEAIEHLEIFKGYHNYLWITIEDLHAVADGVLRNAYQDLKIDRHVNKTVTEDSEISVFRIYNEEKIEEYKAAMRKVDFYLGTLFHYIKENYMKEEVLISLHSDHGQQFIEKENYLFTRKRTNVPFMVYGSNVEVQRSSELMSNVDIVPTLLKICGVECDLPLDGQVIKDFGGKKRDEVMAESIFSGQTYKLAINDVKHLFMFETQENVRGDGLIPLDQYHIQLRNINTGEDETDRYPEKVQKLYQTVYEHIKEWVVFDET